MGDEKGHNPAYIRYIITTSAVERKILNKLLLNKLQLFKRVR